MARFPAKTPDSPGTMTETNVPKQNESEQPELNESFRHESFWQQLSHAVSSFWQRRSKEFRIWCFSSAAWAALVLLYVLMFDPFNTGGYWGDLYAAEYRKMFFVMLLPLFGAVLRFIYPKVIGSSENAAQD